MLFIFTGKDKPDAFEQRLAVRPIHLEHLKSLGDKLVLAGPIWDENEKPQGSLLVLEADSLAAATAAFEADPFVIEGIFASYEIKRWNLVINNLSKKD